MNKRAELAVKLRGWADSFSETEDLAFSDGEVVDSTELAELVELLQAAADELHGLESVPDLGVCGFCARTRPVFEDGLCSDDCRQKLDDWGQALDWAEFSRELNEGPSEE